MSSWKDHELDVNNHAKDATLLGRHEAGFIAEMRESLERAKGHRTPEYNSLGLPRCRPMLLAIGQRMAYEAAVDADVDPNFLALYEAGAVRNDSSWYVEQLRLSRHLNMIWSAKRAIV